MSHRARPRVFQGMSAEAYAAVVARVQTLLHERTPAMIIAEKVGVTYDAMKWLLATIPNKPNDPDQLSGDSNQKPK